ncbi:MAG: PA2778 family cysteine peptidase [Gammaproteobacteria bacterium]
MPVDRSPVHLVDVPFFPQEDFQCGPASLAMMLSWSGRPTVPEELVPLVYVPGRQGSFTVEMAAAARQGGRILYPLAPELVAVLHALQSGSPVLVLQNNGLAMLPLWHFAVVVGVDPARERLWLHSGRTQRMETTFSAFESTWARGGYWAATVVAPGSFTRNLDPAVLVREFALMLKSGDAVAAAAGFSRARAFWPGLPAVWIGLADAERRQGDVVAAERTLRELVRQQPGYAPGLNNLADLLVATGRPAEAVVLAENAVRLMDIPATRATLDAARDALARQSQPSR